MAKKLTKYQAKNSQVKATTDSRTPKGLADGKLSKSVIDYSLREIAEGIINTEKANFKGASDAISKVGNSVYNLLFKKKGGPITAMDKVQNMYKNKKR